METSLVPFCFGQIMICVVFSYVYGSAFDAKQSPCTGKDLNCKQNLGQPAVILKEDKSITNKDRNQGLKNTKNEKCQPSTLLLFKALTLCQGLPCSGISDSAMPEFWQLHCNLRIL